jgi:hypothetical protein
VIRSFSISAEPSSWIASSNAALVGRGNQMPEAGQIRVLIAKEGDYWIAQCLEYDIGVQSRDPNELAKRLMAALEAERAETIRRHGKAFAGLQAAPDHFFKAWDKRVTLFKPAETMNLPDHPEIAVELALAA